MTSHMAARPLSVIIAKMTLFGPTTVIALSNATSPTSTRPGVGALYSVDGAMVMGYAKGGEGLLMTWAHRAEQG